MFDYNFFLFKYFVRRLAPVQIPNIKTKEEKEKKRKEKKQRRNEEMHRKFKFHRTVNRDIIVTI